MGIWACFGHRESCRRAASHAGRQAILQEQEAEELLGRAKLPGMRPKLVDAFGGSAPSMQALQFSHAAATQGTAHEGEGLPNPEAPESATLMPPLTKP